MGTEHYLVDLEARRVLDLHKSYWIGGLVGPVGAAEILEAFDDGDPGRYCHQPRIRVACETWMTQWATGPVVVLTDSDWDDLPFRGDRGFLLDDWTGWTVFSWHGMESQGWTWWGPRVPKEAVNG